MRFAALALAFIVGTAFGADVRAQEVGPLKQGTTYTVKRTAIDGTTRDDSFTVLGEQAKDGRAFLVVQRNDGAQFWYRKETRSIAWVQQEGRMIETYDPDWGDFRWPLKVGESWTSSYRLTTNDGRNLSGVSGTWRVAAEEKVAVPAGTFDTFRIERTPGNQSNHIVIRWYAPELGLIVKQIDRRTNQRGEIVVELTAHQLAP
jgi:hypothetical protein